MSHQGIQAADMGKLPLQAEKGVRCWWLLLEESAEWMDGGMHAEKACGGGKTG
jgi:hypothetical protein